MRVVLLANNRLGWQVPQAIRARGGEIAGLVLHPQVSQRFGAEIIAAAGVAHDRIVEATSLGDEQTLARIAEWAPDIGLSVLFRYVLRPSFLRLFPRGVLNLHPSLLPYNRGASPNIWSIVDGTPSGVTLHYIDEGLDTGDIVSQREVPVEPWDTGASLYRRLEAAALSLFQDAWPDVIAGSAGRRTQAGASTVHRTRDVERIDLIDLEAPYKARDLLNILRARTFPPYPGAYFVAGDERIYVRVELLTEKDLQVRRERD